MNPYRIQGPACVSFSGGRTSAYMLRHIIDAHGGGLPADVHVLFANTGKERPETLDFVRECSERWGVRVRWIEYMCIAAVGVDRIHTYREVTYETASRRGEPFEALILARQFLPNPVMRICTQELKIRPMKKFAMSVLGFDHWTNVIGLRADEPRRVAKTTKPTTERWDNECPLARAGVTESDVMSFWSAQSFDLKLMSHEGNCDLCFLKGRHKIERIMRARPGLAEWWIAQERHGFGKPKDALFRHDRPSYKSLLAGVESQCQLPGFDEDDNDSLPCNCTD